MKIILSPAKTMREREPVSSATQIIEGKRDSEWLKSCIDNGEAAGLPVFLKKTESIMGWLQKLSYDEAKSLWKCNDKITALNIERLKNMDLRRRLTPAVLAYEGIAYQYMAPSVFDSEAYVYVEEHLRILSGFYGVLKPLDGVVPYRLEMGAKARIGASKDLYDFWGDSLYEEVMDESGIVINLASKEYSRCIEKFLKPEDRMITCVFGELSGEKVVQKGTYAKMARGEMVLYLAQNAVEDPEMIKDFNHLDYCFSAAHSSINEFVFFKKNDDFSISE